MTIDMSQFFQVFFEEAAEHLDEMEHLLLDLDPESPRPDDLNAIFRAAHSIKGGSGTFGFTDMTGVTHILESLLDRLRKNEIALRGEMVDAFLDAGDVLRGQLAGHQHGAEVDPQAAANICAKLNLLASGGGAPAGRQQPAAEPAPAVESLAECTYRIEFAPDRQTLERVADFAPLFAELAALGKLEVTELAPEESPTRAWRMALRSCADEAALRDIFDFFAQPDQLKIESEPAGAVEDDQGFGFFTDIAAHGESDPGYGFFTDSAPVESDSGSGFFTDDAPFGEGDPDFGFFIDVSAAPAVQQVDDARGYGFFQKIDPPPVPAETAKKVEAATAEPAPIAVPEQKPAFAERPAGRRATDKAPAAAATESTSIRVSVDKVDQLINLVGELVITQSMLAQTASEVDSAIYEKLLNGLSQLERNTRDLQESVMSIRMMPISFVFSRFPRVVRDLATKLEKKVELVTVGESTELDKGLIEKIADPLTHLVRNSLDHGIEMPEQRIASGKPEKGTITLQAAHQGGNVVISVSDDGAGLNRERILSKAAEKGLPVHDAMPDSEVWQLIFAPGFSTAEVVTDVSGRGVGMDVVKKNILGMGGQVEIESAAGWGSRITVRLPLTLAILDGMSIAVGSQIFIVPLAFITESLQPAKEDVKTVTGEGRLVHVRGEYLPLLALHEVFGIAPSVSEPHQGIVVLLESEGKKAAMLVDELVGQHQVVIKGLETNYRKVPGISAATIMGDGKVALILDIGALIRINQQ